VLDGARPLDDEDRATMEAGSRLPGILVRNKIDLPSAWEPESLSHGARRWVDVSARERLGLDRLCEEIVACAPAPSPVRDGVLITRARHHAALTRAKDYVDAALENVARSGDLELIAADLQAATAELDELVGASSSEDVLDRIFRQFCVGK
jgi:tRNA modification GTPase